VCLLVLPAASASTIHACVKPKSGATRIVSAKARCRRGEQKLSWSTTGPQGKAGPAGAPGTAGGEGKAGPSGVGPVYSVNGGETPQPVEGETLVLSKTVPPGSYLVSAKLDIGATSASSELFTGICALIDAPGTSPELKGTDIDGDFVEQLLGKGTGSEYFAIAPVSLQGTLTSTVTSTVSLGCGNLGSTGPKLVTAFPELQALVVSSVL